MRNKIDLNNSRFVYFEAGPGSHREVQAQQAENPLKRANEKFTGKLGETAFAILKKYQVLFRGGKSHEKALAIAKFGEELIRNIKMTPEELVLLRDSRRYEEPTDFVNPFVVEEGGIIIHFKVKINKKAEIEPVIVWEAPTYD